VSISTRETFNIITKLNAKLINQPSANNGKLQQSKTSDSITYPAEYFWSKNIETNFNINMFKIIVNIQPSVVLIKNMP